MARAAAFSSMPLRLMEPISGSVTVPSAETRTIE